MNVLVCLLNWKTAALTVRALEHCVPQVRALGASRIVVVDNDSRDGSYEALGQAVAERGWSDVVDVVASGRNGGYGFGNNVALRRGLRSADAPRYFHLLNSDAFLDEGALAALVAYLDLHREVGLAGSFQHGLDGEPYTSAFRFPSVRGEIERVARLGFVTRALQDARVPLPLPTATTTDVDWVSGASLMIRREVLEQIGLFDESYFLYFEETDLCLRAKRRGWQVAWVRESSVAHISGASTGISSARGSSERVPRYLLESRRHFWLKNFGRPTLWAVNAVQLAFGAGYRAKVKLPGFSDTERPREWLDAVLFNITNP